MLAPVGSVSLSQQLSQQEYSSLFRADDWGGYSRSRYRSDDIFQQNVSQFGWSGDTAYSVDAEYLDWGGQRPHNELSRFELYTTIKHQLTPRDSLFFLTKIQEFRAEDVRQLTDPARLNPDFEWDEPQYPGLALLGYHRRWNPRNHTLFLAGRLAAQQRFSNRLPSPVFFKNVNGDPIFIRDGAGNLQEAVSLKPFQMELENDFEIYTVEVQQLVATGAHDFVAGIRLQNGTFDTSNTMINPPDDLNQSWQGRFAPDFGRVVVYGYDTWELTRRLWLIGGIAYDEVVYPRNFRTPPVQAGTDRSSRISPKAAVVWRPTERVTLRGLYTRTIGGVTFDESVRLEPTQLAGFPFTFRTIIPESTAGSVAAPEYETAGVALDLKLNQNTYVGLQAKNLRSEVLRERGTFDLLGVGGTAAPFLRGGSSMEELVYEERSVGVSVNRLIDEEWSVGLGYRFSRSELGLERRGASAVLGEDQSWQSDLHRVEGSLLFNDPSGWFAQHSTTWFVQDSNGYAPGSAESAGESVPQVNLFAGYRFRQQRAKITFGILNLTDADYRLNPLTPYRQLPRERVYQVQLDFRF